MYGMDPLSDKAEFPCPGLRIVPGEAPVVDATAGRAAPPDRRASHDGQSLASVGRRRARAAWSTGVTATPGRGG